MSKLYDDLKNSEPGGRRRRQLDVNELELFALAARKDREVQLTPPAPTPPPAAPAPVREEPPAEPPRHEIPPFSAPPAQAPGPAPAPAPAPVPEPPASTIYAPPSGPAAEYRRSPERRVFSALEGLREEPAASPALKVAMIVSSALAAIFVAVFFIGAVVKSVRHSRESKPQLLQEMVKATEPAPAKPAPAKVVPKPVPSPKPAPAPVVANPLPTVRGAGQTARPAAAPAAKPVKPKLGVAGTKVREENGDWVVTFDDGVFEGAAKLSPQAKAMLAEIAGQLAKLGPGLSVTVIGCTDNVPMTKSSKFKDNRELGLMRAREVVRVLQTNADLRSVAFKTDSYGTSWAPYPNDSAANRARNRTAVLRVSANSP